MSFGPPPSAYTASALGAERRARRRRAGAVAAAAVLLLALCGAGMWVFSTGSDDTAAGEHRGTPALSADDIRQTVERTPDTPDGQLLVAHSEKGLAGTTESNPRLAPGTWATGKILAKAVADRIVGYRLLPDSDQEAWTLALDGDICATTARITQDGRTAVAVQKGGKHVGPADGTRCDEIVVFDVDTGEKLWQQPLPAEGAADISNTNLTLTKGVVAAAWGRGSVAYAMRDGSRLWAHEDSAECRERGFAGGRALLALVACGDSGDPAYEVRGIEPRTGRSTWTYKVTHGVRTVYLPSADPPVLAVAAGDATVTHLITLDGRGAYQATVPLDSGLYAPGCGRNYAGSTYFGTTEVCDGMAVGRDRIFLATAFDANATEKVSNWIVAFDVRTGRTAGKFEGHTAQPVIPLRTSGDELLLYRRSLTGVEPAAVLSWNPRTDTAKPFLFFHLPDRAEEELSDPGRSDILVEQGRVFFAKRRLVAEHAHPADPVPAVVGVGGAGLGH
ncbi:outer membrane protein assembly factor BamB family protein [Streptomyces sp. NPDC003703]|uniref:outer membrane protein assembly factor BamB family protein n=1 Tax=Streptomyces sp. NPDC003283 TaxID=3364681 RepID=UPI00368E8A9A